MPERHAPPADEGSSDYVPRTITRQTVLGIRDDSELHAG